MVSHAKKTSSKIYPSLFRGFGIGLILLAGFIFYRLFHDPIKQEVRYKVSTVSPVKADITPVDTDFGIVIDKIGANSAVIQNVDPLDSRKYQLALRDGVAHAKGTKLPGQGGNIFLFAHSSADLLTAERYNSVFYLIHHLVEGDVIKLWYQGHEFDYAVTQKLIVGSDAVSYLTKPAGSEQLTLMTCWPPGTNLKRLIVIAKPL